MFAHHGGIYDRKQQHGEEGSPESREPRGVPLPNELPGLDIVLGLKRLGDNDKLYRNLLLKFRKNHGNAVSAIKTALAKGDRQEAGKLAHTLKGVAGNIGAMEIFEAVRQFENGLKRDHPEITRLLGNIEKALLLLIASITFLDKDGKETPGSDSAVDLARLTPLFSELADLLAENDTAAKLCFETIKETLTGTFFMDKLASLENLIDRYDFDAALLLLHRLAAEIGVTKG